LIIKVENSDRVAQKYQKLITIDFKKKTSDFIVLDIESKNVPFAKKILLDIIDNYNSKWDADHELVTEKTIEFINQRLALSNEALVNADLEIQQFKDTNKLTDIEADVTYYLGMSSGLQAELVKAQTQSEAANILINFLREPKNKYLMIPFGLSTADPFIAGSIAKYNDLLLRRNDFYKADTQSRVGKELDEQLEKYRKNMCQSLGNIKKELDLTLNNLRKKETEFNAKIGSIPSVEKDYAHLAREREVQQAVYIFLLEMREETGMKGSSVLPKLKVIDAPYAKIKPISPDIKKLALVILFFSVVLPFLFLYNQTQRRKRDGLSL
jgi:uncharacterized protein involved in exopolysaccharide biosynthesis